MDGGTTVDQVVTERQRESLSKEGKECLSCGYGFSVSGEDNRCGCKPIVGA